MSGIEKKENLTVRYAPVQCFFWMMFGNVTGFVSVYLLDNGFSNTQIGILIAVMGTLSAVLQPVLAGYADKEKSPSLKKIVSALVAVQLILSVLLLTVHHRSRALTGVFYGSTVMIMQMLTPFINALGMESINQKKKLNFGAARGIGSAGYAAVSYAVGAAIAKTGSASLLISMAAVSLALLISLYRFPFQKTFVQAQKTEKEESGSFFLFIKKYKRFCVTLLGCILVYISHVLLNSFTFQIVESKGGGSGEMGISMAMAALFEMPTLFLFSHMLKKVRCDIWFRISGIFLFLKTLCTLLAPDIPVFYAVQIFQMLGWGLIAVASVYYVNSVMEKQDAIKGQAYMTMTYTLGSVAGALLGGILIDKTGVFSMLVFATISAAAGAVLMLISCSKK